MIYKWKRFWCPREGRINLGDGGFLVDPDEEYGSSLNPDVTAFEALTNARCLILLGEPGTGKSQALVDHKRSTDQSLADSDASLSIDLRGFQTDVRLIQELSENPVIKAWQNGSHDLHLFLDSFDEGLLRVNVLSTIIGDEFQKYPTDRLFVRIACRTLDWPISLEKRFAKIWDGDNLRALEIAPLRRLDVREAARSEGLDDQRFLNEILRTESTPLAIKPVTLRFLLSLFKRSGNFPLNQADLYERGCRLLCEEGNDDRLETKQTGNFTADQRLEVASRIAAATIFGNRNAVWTKGESGDASPEDITLFELTGETETSQNGAFPVTQTAIHETLATGLFSSRGPHRMGWAHQTYAEFLAARFVLNHKLTNEQIMSLLAHPGDKEGKIVPQLQETAGWIAGKSLDIFRTITRSDPQVLLRSDVARATGQARQELVDALLKGTENDELFMEIEERSDFHKLSHDGIEDQLRSCILDPNRRVRARELAIEIAQACKVQGLQNDAAKIALDSSEPYFLRKRATFFVSEVGEIWVRATLEPLTMGSADDVDDDLKGWALRAVWPDCLVAEELFGRLSLPKRESYFGGYKAFLRQLENSIASDMLPVALQWAETKVCDQWGVGKLIDKILIVGFENIEKPQVLVPYIRVVMKRITETHAVLSDRSDNQYLSLLRKDQIKRRHLITNLIQAESDSVDSALGMYRISHFLVDEDFSWLIGECVSANSSELISRLVRLVHNAFNMNISEHVDSAIGGAQKSSALRIEFDWLLTPIELGSPQAAEMKKSYEEHLRFSTKKEPPPIVPPLSERLETLILQSESGKPDAFIELSWVVSVDPKTGRYGDEYVADITKSPGWQSADGNTRNRILEAARRFIAVGDPTWEWVGTDRITYAALAGYRAMRLLFQMDKGAWTELAPQIWRRWTPAIIGHPFPTIGDDGEAAFEEFVAMVQKHAPEETVRAVKLLLEKEDKAHSTVFVLRHFRSHWSQELGTMLMDIVESETLSPGGTEIVLGELLNHDHMAARQLLVSWLPIPLPSDLKIRERSEIAARLLIENGDEESWSAVWSAIQSDTAFGRKIAESTFGRIGYGKVPRMSEDHLADLYVWLVQQYPFSEDPQFEGVHSVGSRELIGQFRNGIIGHLSSMGTHGSVSAIEKVIEKFPELTGLKWSLQQAREATRRKTWTPPQIQDLIRLSHEKQRRFVQSGAQLLQAVTESLQRLEDKLQGETPAAVFLWNRLGKEKWRPKDENELSDFVKIHLDDDLKKNGIIVNREVQIRRGYKPGKGEITDLHVDAVALDGRGREIDRLTVIVEVKGCWNNELNTAMETQLKGRYLKDNNCDCGIYLVGWFSCPHWDKSDSRKPPTHTFEEGKNLYDGQAKSLSTGGITLKAFVLNVSLRS